MHTPQILHTRRSLATAALMLATFATGSFHSQAQTLTGDQRVIPDGSEPGNLDADGDLGWGRTPGSPGAVAGKLRYFESPAQLAFDATEADAIFTWNDDATDTLRDFKMKLDANNVLSLYKTDGSAASISLTPDTGAIKLSGTGAGLFNGSGGGVLQIDGSGRPYFATKPIFQDGVDFGSGGTLDSAKVQHLQSLLTGFGYDPNASSYSDATTLAGAPGVSIYKVVAANGYLHWTGYLAAPTKIGSTTYDPVDGRYLVVKSNPNGTPVWVKQIKMTTQQGYLGSETIAVNASGTIALAGMVSGTTSNLGAQQISGSSDGYVLVLNSSGVQQWSKIYSSNNSDRAFGVAIDASGNVAVTGTFDGSSVLLGPGIAINKVGGYADSFVVKHNSTGGITFASTIGGTGWDAARVVAFAPSGNVIVGGFGDAITNLGAANPGNAGQYDAWVVAYNSTGTVQWGKNIGGTGGDELRDMAVDSSGNIIVGAQFSGTTTSLGSYNRTSVGGSDGLVVGLNSSGTPQWSTAFGSTGANDNIASVKIDSAGAIVVGAQAAGTTTTLGSSNVPAGGALVVLNSSGAVSSAQNVGGVGGVTLYGAAPIGSLSSGLALYGFSNTNAILGDTKIPYGAFVVTLPNGTITSPALSPAAPLEWNGGLASGTNSTAVGNLALASGTASVAFGEGAALGAGAFASGSGRATGDGSTAFGTRTTALGSWATAFGVNTNAWGSGSFVTGNGSSAIGNSSVALGEASSASGNFAFAAGYVAQAVGEYSTAMGESPIASGYASVALGGWSNASGDGAVALGYGSIASGDLSFTANMSTTADSYLASAFGQYNIGGGHAENWIDTDPIFEIGNGTTGPANALTVIKNGRTTLSNRAWKAAVTVDPEEALEDPADANDSGGEALVVDGHTRLRGKVIIEKEQGDISMGIYE